jgi:hypothetical protein
MDVREWQRPIDVAIQLDLEAIEIEEISQEL